MREATLPPNTIVILSSSTATADGVTTGQGRAMPDKRHWSAVLASGLANLAGRIDERQASVNATRGADAVIDDIIRDPRPGTGAEAEPAPDGTAPAEDAAPAPEAVKTAAPATPAAVPVPTAAVKPTAVSVPAQRTAPPLADPVAAVPWSMRVGAEIGWRLLVLAGTVWVLMRVIGAVQLVVLAFTAGLLITALLQPFVARLKRRGVPRGVATAMVFVGGFVIMGLVGWFVVWQVMDNIDNLSSSLQDGVNEGKKWLLNSPFHVTDDQINQVAKNLQAAIGSNTKALTDAGLQGVTVIVELLTGMLLAMFSTLFLLYDGPNIWNWFLRLFPEAARDGLAGAGPRAWRTLTLYVRGTVIVALIDAIFIGVGIFFLGVPMAVPLAVVIFLSSFVPLVGAVASGFIAVVVALVTEGPFTALMVLVVVLAVQQIEGHILQPFILGRAVRVHPLAVVLSVAAGSMIAGIGGAVVAVPLVAVGNTVVGYLRAHAKEKALALAAVTNEPHGATAYEVAPVAPPAPVEPEPEPRLTEEVAP
ncbi:Predicted PurR-regulated permease PerM [Actinacidiphila alni]|uniref:Predicted PurR-regulated permease PerM n=2 Tax=Actinacidiphila alni TaxID=380248 RepID=A0A1I2IYX3_9ACTN|nr:Predicted PurR-regulated permease PerM [Actinacidiphila alni]